MAPNNTGTASLSTKTNVTGVGDWPIRSWKLIVRNTIPFLLDAPRSFVIMCWQIQSRQLRSKTSAPTKFGSVPVSMTQEITCIHERSSSIDAEALQFLLTISDILPLLENVSISYNGKTGGFLKVSSFVLSAVICASSRVFFPLLPEICSFWSSDIRSIPIITFCFSENPYSYYLWWLLHPQTTTLQSSVINFFTGCHCCVVEVPSEVQPQGTG